MFHAATQLDALSKAESNGQQSSERIVRPDGSIINWEFVGVEEVNEFKQQDGAEVMSQTATPDSEAAYLYTLRARAAQLTAVGTAA